ncbi:HipA domain-containing protein [Bradyrhizobium sp. CIAT3101]|uniref:HipA domain-containing protein n=1 Tax=Bradyrhizobium sp. CIAT3101 TaxID=439387 RepID=UPI0024B04BC0|nr:HipA domain-containing protein [Bradyrhizobium sp. CIAT3101]WFU85617.1 HipA domain-containing protein [Bradyrhizobium sp. CIAT3101]
MNHNGNWVKPHSTTRTTHIFKTQIGKLPNGTDLSNSVENEYCCLKLADAFGLPANRAHIATFGKTTALLIERFDEDGQRMAVCSACRRKIAVKPCRSRRRANTRAMAAPDW